MMVSEREVATDSSIIPPDLDSLPAISHAANSFYQVVAAVHTAKDGVRGDTSVEMGVVCEIGGGAWSWQWSVECRVASGVGRSG